jgi:predicted enzyme related to lactoylglutathione lyase
LQPVYPAAAFWSTLSADFSFYGGQALKRVTGLGGIFFKSQNPIWLYEWYEKHLGIQRDDPSSAIFHWRDPEQPSKKGMTVLSIFPAHTKHFGEGQQSFMLNYRVDDLNSVLKELRAEGVKVDPKVEEYEYGKFGWIYDPDGNRIELWEPPPEKRTSAGRAGVKAKPKGKKTKTTKRKAVPKKKKRR